MNDFKRLGISTKVLPHVANKLAEIQIRDGKDAAIGFVELTTLANMAIRATGVVLPERRGGVEIPTTPDALGSWTVDTNGKYLADLLWQVYGSLDHEMIYDYLE